MRKLTIILAMFALISVLSSCDEKPEAFEGESTTTFVVNANDAPLHINLDDKNILVCSLSIDVTDEKLIEALEAKRHWIENAVISVAGTRTLETIHESGAQKALESELRTALMQMFNVGDDVIFKVSFTRFHTAKI